MHPRSARVSGHQLDLPEQGGGEGLASARAGRSRVLAQPPRELGQARVRITGMQYVLGDAQVAVEDPTGELGDVPDLGELPPGVALPGAGGVGDEGLEVGESRAIAVRWTDEGAARSACRRASARSPAYQAVIPRATASRPPWDGVAAVRPRRTADAAAGSPTAVSACARLIPRSVRSSGGASSAAAA